MRLLSRHRRLGWSSTMQQGRRCCRTVCGPSFATSSSTAMQVRARDGKGSQAWHCIAATILCHCRPEHKLMLLMQPKQHQTI